MASEPKLTQVEIKPETNIRIDPTLNSTTNIFCVSSPRWIACAGEAMGRLNDGDWWRVEFPIGDTATKTLWVLASRVRRAGAPPVVVTPPKPDPVPVVPPQPAPGDWSKLGSNVLANHRAASEEAARGGDMFLVMNGFQQAGELKQAHPNAIVMARRFFDHGWMPNPDQMIAGLEGARHGPIIYIGINEGDQIGQRGENLRKRARNDIAVARKIKELNPGATFAAGTLSMGETDFTDEANCQIMREEYAPHYNSGLIAFDMHLYSPNMTHIDKPAEHIWFERRWEFLFTKCGFDPTVRSIYCSETGIDEGGVGGFPAHGASAEYFRDWCRKYIALNSAPLIVRGKAYPSPLRGSAIFQVGGNGDKRWEGYNITGYLPTLRDFYKSPTGGRALRMPRLGRIDAAVDIRHIDRAVTRQMIVRRAATAGGAVSRG